MLAIQSGGNWWVDSYAAFSGGQIDRSRFSIENTISSNLDASGMGDPEDSLTSVISDVEEEGEVETAHHDPETDASLIDSISDEISAGTADVNDSTQTVASAAKFIGVIEAAMRQHQATGTSNFDDDDADTDFTDDASSLTDDMQSNPDAAFAATIAGQDRMGILALLSN